MKLLLGILNGKNKRHNVRMVFFLQNPISPTATLKNITIHSENELPSIQILRMFLD